MRLHIRIYNKLFWSIINPIIWNCIWALKANPKNRKQNNNEFSIGVTTYIARFDTYFKRTINKLVYFFPDTEIIVAINGYYDKEKQLEYIEKIKIFLNQFKNVRYFYFIESQSLSKMWNKIIQRTANEKILILNDDIDISNHFRKELSASNILNHELGRINISFSHYVISKSLIKKNGWFEERFEGFGGEDHDYCLRYFLNCNEGIKNFLFRTILNIVDKPLDYSWGKDHKLANGKYSSSNNDFFFHKWVTSKEPIEGFTYHPVFKYYYKINPELVTPNFYPEIKINSNIL